MEISEDGKQMQEALKRIVVPYLRELGFKGSYPHFKKIGIDRIDLLSFQTSFLGGGMYFIDIAVVLKSDF